MLRVFVAFGLSCLLAPLARAAEPSPAQVFEQLSGLVGSWEGRFANGREHRIDYRLSAGGSVLVETWALAPGRESMTLYHMDGERLLATHYCPQGNQPRLAYAGSESGALQFRFVDGTGLQDPERSHQHAFSLRLPGEDGSMERSETYVANTATAEEIGKAQSDGKVRYRRIAAQD